MKKKGDKEREGRGFSVQPNYLAQSNTKAHISISGLIHAISNT